MSWVIDSKLLIMIEVMLMLFAGDGMVCFVKIFE